ncbi:hypothetical protein [Streptomyces tsukubensis]|uniref:hypothetical protein n=1 Tax=Streptomyces tsukubensis TaxID=83656 RepID=UPI00117D1827|nr:hypothetical protein [Streptomyces tsukubensis]QFR94744.1 hypothetical protein GBW32_18995 [Streptomyces tsukubensis]
MVRAHGAARRRHPRGAVVIDPDGPAWFVGHPDAADVIATRVVTCGLQPFSDKVVRIAAGAVGPA